MTDAEIHTEFMAYARARQLANERAILIKIRDKALAKEAEDAEKPPDLPEP